MAKDPAFLFYPGDYLRDTQCLSEKVQVSYDRIMCEHMRNICITQQQLKFFTKRLNDDELEELKMVLTKLSGGYCIDWVVDSIEKRRKYSESRRNNRTGHTKDKNNICESYDSHMDNEDVNEDEDITNNKIDFELFWNAYDKKVDRKKCKKKWDNLTKEIQDKIIIHIPLYKTSQPNKQFRKDPITFFNNEAWENEIIISDPKQNEITNAKLTHNDVLILFNGKYPIPPDKDIWDKVKSIKENDKTYWVYK